VAKYGAEYFTDVTHVRGIKSLAVVPLADATTMPTCPLPSSVLVVPAFHGGLLGDEQVQATVSSFLSGGGVPRMVQSESDGLHAAADAISDAAAAWRMPAARSAC
jgi:hypothetical protein